MSLSPAKEQIYRTALVPSSLSLERAPKPLSRAAASAKYHLLQGQLSIRLRRGGNPVPQLPLQSSGLWPLLPLLKGWQPVRSTRDTWRYGLSAKEVISQCEVQI